MRYKRYLLLLALISPIVAFFLYKPPLMEGMSFSRAVYDRNGQLLRLTISKDDKYRLPLPLSDISPQLIDGVMLHEDGYFFRHIGVNPASLFRAFIQTYFTSGRRVGASTITMQLARLRYDIHSRHIPGKLWQIMRAIQLEMHYSKKELLEAYFTLAPYGKNIEGVGAASLIYFGKKARDLTLPEALTLAVIPQSPSKRTPKPLATTVTDNPLFVARNQLYAKWLTVHPKDQSQQLFFRLPLTVKQPKQLPFIAPQFSERVLKETKDFEINTTIDSEKQQLLERLIRNYILEMQPYGISNASALLLDYRTMETLTYVGSANFFNKTIHGQVDGTMAKRSPGSTLKPFIYALALDQGLIHPLTLLHDSPRQFAGYVPENFDHSFKGPITATDALMYSRNLPALWLANNLKTPNLYGFLTNAAIEKLRPEATYGLSLVLGGAEVTMHELASLYAMLANNGNMQKPIRIKASSYQPPNKLLSPEASFLTLQMLKNTPRPASVISNHTVYWKTGTSNGYRDAWTVGIAGPYALVVWVGNFNGQSNPSFIGIRSAAPLFFHMLHALHLSTPLTDSISPKATSLTVRQADICTISGDIADSYCQGLVKGWVIPGKSPIKKTAIYRRVLINTTTGLRTCKANPKTSEYRIVEFLPSDLWMLYKNAGITRPLPPPLEPDCTQVMLGEGNAPIITSPAKNVVYSLRINSKEKQPIPLQATVDGDVKNLFWFENSRLLGSAEPNDSFLWEPSPGRYTIRAVDNFGRSSSREVLVGATE